MSQTPTQFPPNPGYAPPPPPKKKHTVRNVLLGLLGLFFLIGACSAILNPSSSSDTSSDSSASDNSATDTNTSDNTAPAPTKKKEAPAKPAKPALTSGQENALRAAKNYLSFAPFSKAGLINQLASPAGDKYPMKDAVYAANHVGANWNEQAAKAAKNYLAMTAFSRDGMIQQLSSSAGDKYTRAQAEYGATKAGLN